MTSTSHLASILSAALLAGAMLPGGLAAEQTGSSPVKIFILAGQSNMVGLGQVGSETTTPGTVRYLIANEPKYAFLGDGVGGFRVYDDVWIRERTNGGGQLTVGYGGGSPGSNIGPEMGFGEVVSGLYEEQILIIKTAWGNRDLDYDFRPPSSGPFTGQMRANDPGFAYREMLDIINDVTDNLATYFPDYDGGGFEFAGFAWHQGWNDRIDATRSAAYEINMANFIRDVRTDLGAPGLPFVIATSAMDFNFQYTEVELAQLAMADAAKFPEFDGNVAIVDARQPYKGMEFWQFRNDSPSGDGIHWNQNAKTYTNLGLAMGDAISAMIPARGPYRLEATSDATGVTLTWSEGEETPTALQVLRNGVEIAASAPFDPPFFFDAAAEPSLIEYTLSFSMPGEPTPDLSLTFDAGITALEAYRFRNSVKLSWENNLDYTAIEIRRDGVLIEPALDCTATSYVDETPPASGTVVYSVVPTHGSASPIEVSINLDGLSPGNAYIYEPFNDPDSSLTENVVGAGLQGHWFGGLNVASGSMSFGILPTSGNQSFNGGGANSAGAFLRSEFADAGLLDDGAEVWFSFLTNNTASINTGVYLHLGTARSSFFGGMDDGGEAIGVYIASGTTPQAATWAPGRSTSSSTGSIPGDTTALIVGKITWGADANAPDTVEIYLPNSDLVLPSMPVSTRSAVLDQSKFNVLGFGGKNAGSPKIDEIRFATNYADVIATDQMAEDTTPPSPDPMTWATVPTALGDSSITMTATTATDLNEVEYYFENVSGGGNDSGWQDSPTYVDTGLAAETEFSYRVQARDKTPALNTTGWSPTASATTDPVDSGAPPTPGFAVAPVATSPTAITMTAETVVDPEGSAVEYYFTETSGNPGGNDSGWQDSTTYTDNGLTPSTTYSYTVTARDESAQQNQSAPSAVFFATTQDIPSGPGGAFVYEPFDQTPVGADLDTTTGAGIGLAGNWSNAGVDYIMRSGSLTFGTLATSGNSIMTDANGGADVAYNTLSVPITNGGEVWFSFLFQSNNFGSNPVYMFAIADGRIDDMLPPEGIASSGTGFGIELKSGTAGTFTGTDNDFVDGTGSGGNPGTNTTQLYVGRIMWDVDANGTDVLELYMPSSADFSTPGPVVSTASGIFTNNDLTTVSFGNRQNTGTIYDELRFGTTYLDAVGLGGSSDNDYDTWAADFAPADLSDPNADFDGDGMSNRVERLWGLDPTDGSSVNPITSGLDASTGTLSYTRRDNALTGATYTYQWSTTLAPDSWTSFTPVLEISDDGSPVETVTITLDDDLLPNPKLFIRVIASEE